MDIAENGKSVTPAADVHLPMGETPADQQHPASHLGLQTETPQGRLSWIDQTARRLSERFDRELGGPWLKIRYLVVFCCFLANAISYMMRVNLSVAIVAMTSTDGPEDVPHYDWDESIRGTILSSFFWGYIVTQVPSGYVAARYSATKLLFCMMLVATAATLLFPTAADLGWETACVARVILGLAQGSLLPCCHALLAKWSPPGERGRMSVYAYTGQPFGNVVALSCSGLIAASAGWPWVFYATGAIGLFTSVLFILLAADSPAVHKLASRDEREYIETSIGINSVADNTQRLRTPWKAILTSVPMWALIIVHCGQNWGFWTLLTEIPSYMDGVLGFDLKQVMSSRLDRLFLSVKPLHNFSHRLERSAVRPALLGSVDLRTHYKLGVGPFSQEKLLQYRHIEKNRKQHRSLWWCCNADSFGLHECLPNCRGQRFSRGSGA
ncbi:Hypothetical predicted protein [Cloeon dipterum]|uniref:Major facilitator superfamily (MFS) profile domain-containing protein n=1 Tax=Cloeon dipterum TaxID=197152 RepID=A0A8S1C1A6_9INSE|nr:Hypothetical predicted protein [Cloeon dipterum]